MSSLLITKTLGIVGGIAGVSAIGGAIAYKNGLFSDSKLEKNEITLISNKKRLADEGFQVLDTEKDSDDWQTVLTAYLKATKGSFTGQKDTNRNKDTLRTECKRQLDLSAEASYLLTRQWCVKQEKMSEILERKSKVLITTEATTDDNEWKIKINNLTEADKTSLSVEKGAVETENITSIKKGCGTVSEKKTTDTEFNKKFEVAKRVCTVSKD